MDWMIVTETWRDGLAEQVFTDEQEAKRRFSAAVSEDNFIAATLYRGEAVWWELKKIEAGRPNDERRALVGAVKKDWHLS